MAMAMKREIERERERVGIMFEFVWFRIVARNEVEKPSLKGLK